MKASLILIIINCCVLSILCQKEDKNNNSPKQCNSTGIFNRLDSDGSFTGIIASFSDTSHSSSSGGIEIISGKGDTITFLFTYSDTIDIDIGKLKIGECIEIKYYVDIIRENGDEINRIFYITKIDYEP